MKALYKCDFCDMTDTEKNVYIHEATCTNNPNRKSCQYCKNRKISLNPKTTVYTCDFKDIPEGQQYINCDKFVLKEMPTIGNIFDSFFTAEDD